VLIFEQFIGFDWDEGNRGKNWDKHRVSDSECEQIFSTSHFWSSSMKNIRKRNSDTTFWVEQTRGGVYLWSSLPEETRSVSFPPGR